tara:strand:- start:3641 stop:6046 length:2406 start_codon:yes stop_codon:yes gene_type:complete
MKFTHSWLMDHLETDATSEEIANTLTKIGLEIENVTNPGDLIKEFIVVSVDKVSKHPNADRLKICLVNNGEENYEVICGAPNAREGIKGVFAREGQFIPGLDLKLKKSEIRGVVSNGMLLSEKELGISDDHEGIVELSGNFALGSSAANALGLSDIVYEIAITPNRSDCLGIRGIARDLAAAGMGTLKPLDVKPVKPSTGSPIEVNIDFDEEDKSACPYFVGRYFRNVNNGESPDWLKRRLLSVGLRPISVLVDITNYFTFTFGRPLHVFDADKVSGNIVVRLSKKGENLLALDGKNYDLDDEMTVIADEKRPEALAGVMGGELSGCTSDTKNVFLEAAYFDPIRTAITGRKLNLQSDARFRFERGIDPLFQRPGAELASQMILDLCGGQASDLIVAGNPPSTSKKNFLREDRVKKLGGVDIPSEKIESILLKLGFEPTKSRDGWNCITPSWRHDIEGEADLVEEVLRIYGFDKIPTNQLDVGNSLPTPAVNTSQERRSFVRRFLALRGLTEAVTFSFLSEELASMFGGGKTDLKLVNPISSDLSVMRPNVVANLLSALGRNSDRGQGNGALFEVGPQFQGTAPGDQSIVASGVRIGKVNEHSWLEESRNIDIFDVKADLLETLTAIEININNLSISRDTPSYYHPGRSGSIKMGPKNIVGFFGEIHPSILSNMGFRSRAVAFELFLDNIPLPKTGKGFTKEFLELSPYQAVERDFAFTVDIDRDSDQIVSAIRAVDKKLIKEVLVFDLFVDGTIGKNKKSIGIRVQLQPLEATFSDKEIDDISQKIVDSIREKVGGELRK